MFQHKLRTLEVLHQDDFGVINFSKYSTNSRSRFNPRFTPIRIQTHKNMEGNFSEYDTLYTFDSETELIQSRRQSNAPHERKRGNFGRSKNGTKKGFVFDRHDEKHLLENNLYKSLSKKDKTEFLGILDANEYDRFKELKTKFIK